MLRCQMDKYPLYTHLNMSFGSTDQPGLSATDGVSATSSEKLKAQLIQKQLAETIQAFEEYKEVAK